MTTDDDGTLRTADQVAEDEEGGGAAATLINVALFAFMVIFAVGCGLLGWFG